MLRSFLRDLHHAARALLAQPGFTAAAVLTFALGIGANAAVFSAIEGRLLRPLPYPDAERLVQIHNTYLGLGVDDAGTTVPDFLDRRAAPALVDSAIYVDYSYDLAAADAPLRVAGVQASPSLFGTLGVGAALGRTFEAADATAGNDRVVLLSDALWRNLFDADSAIVGRTLRISGQMHRVIGVMPATFAFPRREVALWLPFVPTERQRSDAMRGFEFARSIGRLAPGATIAQLDTQLDAITARALERLAGANADGGADFRARAEPHGFTGRARSLHAVLAGDIAPRLWLLQAAVALLLLTACANVANLLLLRVSGRQHELGVRLALGAARGRIARQLLAESGMLAVLGGAAGLVVAWIGIVMLRRLGLDGSEQGFGIGVGMPLLAVTLLASLACGVLAGLAPLAAVAGLGNDALRSGARSTAGRDGATRRSLLVVAQLALAVALLFGTGLLLHSFLRLQQQDPGFDSANLVSASVNLSRDRYREVAQTRRFGDRLLAKIRAVPGIASAGILSGMPLSEDYGSSEVVVEGGAAAGEEVVGNYRVADAALFATMRIPLRRGRVFDVRDDAASTPVVVIDEALARRAFGERDPVGQRLATASVTGEPVWHTIVGVVGNVRDASLARDGAPTFYFAFVQQPTRIFRVAMRTALAPSALLPSLRAAMARVDPDQPLWDVTAMQARVAQSLAGERATMLLVLLFAAVALAVCGIGIHGVLGYSVAQRTGEIGVRMALGADRRRVTALVLRDAARMVLPGLVLGVAAALALGWQLRAMLFGVEVLDPITLLGVLVLVAAVAALASWLPARRAARVSPLHALRHA